MKIKLPIAAQEFKSQVQKYFNGGRFTLYLQGHRPNWVDFDLETGVVSLDSETGVVFCPVGLKAEFYCWDPGEIAGGIMYRSCDPHPWMCSAQTQAICCGYGLSLEDAMKEELHRLPVLPIFRK